jgi:hypothetical protein
MYIQIDLAVIDFEFSGVLEYSLLGIMTRWNSQLPPCHASYKLVLYHISLV